MATLVKRGGTYHGRHIIRESGKRREITKSMRTGDQRVAFARLAEWEKELDADRHGEHYSPPFEDASRRWINGQAQVNEPTTITRYETSLRQLNPFFRGRRLSSLTTADLEKFEAKRRRDPGRTLAKPGERGVTAVKDNGRGKRKAQVFAPVTGSSIRRDLSCLSALLSYATSMGWVSENIVPKFLNKDGKRKSLKATNARTRYLSHPEQSRLELAAAARKQGSEFDRRMFLDALVLAIETGIRKEEMHKLRWQDVQLGIRPQIAVIGKGRKRRSVPLTPRAAEIVAGILLPPTRPRGTDWVICRADGRRIGSFDKALDEACKRAGINDFTWHDLRRTCGCRLLQDRGFSMTHVRDWMGHSSADVTERHYAFLRTEDLHAAVERSEELKSERPAAEVVPLRRRGG